MVSGVDKGMLEGDPKGYFLLVPQQVNADDEVNLRSLLLRLWRGWKWLVASVVLCAGIAALHAYATDPVYRAETTVIVRGEALQGSVGALRGQLGGLASIAGITLGAGGDRRQEFLAVLKARQLAREFVAEKGLLPVLFAESWEAQARKFIPDDEGRIPTLTDGADYFQYLCEVRDDMKSGLIFVTVEWSDPDIAAQWATEYVAFANRQLQREAIRTAQESIKYLNDEIQRTTVEPIRQSLYRMLESRLNEAMMATVQHEYAFKVVDQALPAQKHQFVRPKRLIEIVVGVLCGLMFGAIVALWRNPAPSATR